MNRQSGIGIGIGMNPSPDIGIGIGIGMNLCLVSVSVSVWRYRWNTTSKSHRKGICTKQTYAILALKSVFGRIGDVFMIYLEFCEKIKSFF